MEQRNHRKLALSLAALLALAACHRSPVQPGFKTVELVHRVSGRQERETILYGRDALKFVRPDGAYILRYADRTVFTLDDTEKTYTEMSLEQFLSQQKEKDHQPDLPDLVSSVGAEGFKIDQTGEVVPFGGVTAKLTRITADKVEVELLLSDEIVPPGPKRQTFEFLQAIGGPLALPAVLFDHLGGFPVRSIVRVKGGMFGEIKVTRALLSLEKGDPSPQTFAVPGDYRKAA